MNLKERKCVNGHVGYYVYAKYKKFPFCKECKRIEALIRYYVLRDKYKNNIPSKPNFCKVCNSTDLHWYSTRWICKPCDSKRRKKLYKRNKLLNFYKQQEKNEKSSNISSSTNIL